tara:strand:+ start:655 stop:837 length:183 start_codon:yes stop_codon:yes gene_type:complete
LKFKRRTTTFFFGGNGFFFTGALLITRVLGFGLGFGLGGEGLFLFNGSGGAPFSSLRNLT